jgi:hypothetical protein
VNRRWSKDFYNDRLIEKGEIVTIQIIMKNKLKIIAEGYRLQYKFIIVWKKGALGQTYIEPSFVFLFTKVIGIYHHYQPFYCYILITRLERGESPDRNNELTDETSGLGRYLETLTMEVGNRA